MSATVTPPLPGPVLPAPHPTPPPVAAPPVTFMRLLYRFTVGQFQRMTELDVLTADDRVELLEGMVVQKMPHNAPHAGTIQALTKRLGRRLVPGWELRVQLPLVLGDGQPEPDFAVVQGDETTYFGRQPTAADACLVIEVADSSRLCDRRDKARIYARAGIPVYWIVNLVDRRVEVLTNTTAQVAPSFSASDI